MSFTKTFKLNVIMKGKMEGMWLQFKKVLLIGVITSMLVVSLVSLCACGILPNNKMEYVINEDGETCTITGFHNKYIAVLRIPESIDGYTVTSIAPYAFEKFEMGTVYLPNTIETIGEFAFSHCEKLAEVK